MRDWSIGLNNYWFKGSIHLEEVPFFWYYFDNFVSRVCDCFSWIPFLDEWFHLYVCSKVCDIRYAKTKVIYIPMPYFFLLEKFPERFKDENIHEYMDEEKVVINKEEALKLFTEFMVAYDKVESLSGMPKVGDLK
jgi:hypothetical protein